MKIQTASDRCKYLSMRLAANTFDIAANTRVYWDKPTRDFWPKNLLGLYKDKSVRAIGKIIACITAIKADGKVAYDTEFGELTDEHKAIINNIIR